MIDIIYEDNHLLVVNKPCNVPVQSDDSKDNDLLTILKQYLKRKYHKPGNVYLGLVQRLDRPVSGIMVFAKTSKAASRLSAQIRSQTMQKEYQAIVMGKLKTSDTFEDYLLKDPNTNMTRVDPKGKYAKLSYELMAYQANMSLVKIKLATGRSHQIRVQFATRGYPLYGDMRYNHKAQAGEQIALCATSLAFDHPTTKEHLTFTIEVPKTYPWTIYKA